MSPEKPRGLVATIRLVQVPQSAPDKETLLPHITNSVKYTDRKTSCGVLALHASEKGLFISLCRRDSSGVNTP